MKKASLPYRTILILLLIAILLKAFSLSPALVERWYTFGLYPFISRSFRLLTGWLPVSIGDLLYASAVIFIFVFILRSLKKARTTPAKIFWPQLFYNLIRAGLLVYIFFNALWGLNYNRQGIARQLNLQVKPYTLPDVLQLTETVQARLNQYAAQTDSIKRNELDNNTKLFQKAISVYAVAENRFPFLHYAFPSVKPSLYSRVGHYFGFTGYYNPFSGEAQIKTSVPVFLKPFVATHEIAHQLGYAKENEANFVAFLSSRQSADVDVLYSLYYDLYSYALREVYSRDTAAAMGFKKSLHPQVLRDNETFKAYFISTQNSVEPLITRFYDQYLKWNNQREGVQTYNEVVALLIAYGKKWGWQAI